MTVKKVITVDEIEELIKSKYKLKGVVWLHRGSCECHNFSEHYEPPVAVEGEAEE